VWGEKRTSRTVRTKRLKKGRFEKTGPKRMGGQSLPKKDPMRKSVRIKRKGLPPKGATRVPRDKRRKM